MGEVSESHSQYDPKTMVDVEVLNTPQESQPSPSENVEVDEMITQQDEETIVIEEKKETEENLEIFEVNKTIRSIQSFINDDLSNWYIRRSRRRFWATELTEDKKAVYNTTYELLTELCKMIAPFAPYLSEEIYRDLTGEKSVHLAGYPKANEELIDLALEEKMEITKTLVTLGRASREESKIKVRQPIQKVLVDGKYKEQISDVADQIGRAHV